MNAMKQTLTRVSLFVAVVSFAVALSAAYMPVASANVFEDTGGGEGVSRCDPDDDTCGDPALNCVPGGSNAGNCDLYRKYINPIIWFLSALVGLAVTIGIIMGGIRYAASGGDPSQAANAKNQIKNAVIAMVVFLFLLAALNWLIPGGLR